MEPLSNGGSEAKADRSNVWIVPLAYISHVKCLLQFGKQLALHGVTVTLFCTEGDAERLGLHDNRLGSWKGDGLDIRLRIFDFHQPELADGDNGSERGVAVIHEQEESFELILKHELELGQSKPTCVISDMWLPGVYERTMKYEVPAWVFSPFSAGYTGGAVYIAQLKSKGILKLPSSPLDKESQEEVISLPGLPLLRVCEIETSWFSSDPLHLPGSRNGPTVQKSEVVILSGFEELEIRTLCEFRKLLQNAAINEKRKVGKVYTVGPTFPFASKGVRSTLNGVEDDQRHPCLKFLDKQPDASVLLVAFGNDFNHTPQQMQEIAYGLQDSQQGFLCALHAPKRTPQYPTAEMFDVISPDCITRTKDRGLFVQGSVPQLEILSHPAVGGFLSHCGRNSCLESVSMGIPLLTWPLTYDQMMNARSIVDDIEIGLEISKCLDTPDLVDRKEVERKVRALFQGEEGKTVRSNAQRMRELAIQSTSENGSTHKNMKEIVARIQGMV